MSSSLAPKALASPLAWIPSCSEGAPSQSCCRLLAGRACSTRHISRIFQCSAKGRWQILGWRRHRRDKWAVAAPNEVTQPDDRDHAFAQTTTRASSKGNSPEDASSLTSRSDLADVALPEKPRSPETQNATSEGRRFGRDPGPAEAEQQRLVGTSARPFAPAASSANKPIVSASQRPDSEGPGAQSPFAATQTQAGRLPSPEDEEVALWGNDVNVASSGWAAFLGGNKGGAPPPDIAPLQVTPPPPPLKQDMSDIHAGQNGGPLDLDTAATTSPSPLGIPPVEAAQPLPADAAAGDLDPAGESPVPKPRLPNPDPSVEVSLGPARATDSAAPSRSQAPSSLPVQVRPPLTASSSGSFASSSTSSYPSSPSSSSSSSAAEAEAISASATATAVKMLPDVTPATAPLAALEAAALACVRASAATEQVAASARDALAALRVSLDALETMARAGVVALQAREGGQAPTPAPATPFSAGVNAGAREEEAGLYDVPVGSRRAESARTDELIAAIHRLSDAVEALVANGGSGGPHAGRGDQSREGGPTPVGGGAQGAEADGNGAKAAPERPPAVLARDQGDGSGWANASGWAKGAWGATTAWATGRMGKMVIPLDTAMAPSSMAAPSEMKTGLSDMGGGRGSSVVPPPAVDVTQLVAGRKVADASKGGGRGASAFNRLPGFPPLEPLPGSSYYGQDSEARREAAQVQVQATTGAMRGGMSSDASSTSVSVDGGMWSGAREASGDIAPESVGWHRQALMSAKPQGPEADPRLRSGATEGTPSMMGPREGEGARGGGGDGATSSQASEAQVRSQQQPYGAAVGECGLGYGAWHHASVECVVTPMTGDQLMSSALGGADALDPVLRRHLRDSVRTRGSAREFATFDGGDHGGYSGSAPADHLPGGPEVEGKYDSLGRGQVEEGSAGSGGETTTYDSTSASSTGVSSGGWEAACVPVTNESSSSEHGKEAQRQPQFWWEENKLQNDPSKRVGEPPKQGVVSLPDWQQPDSLGGRAAPRFWWHDKDQALKESAIKGPGGTSTGFASTQSNF